MKPVFGGSANGCVEEGMEKTKIEVKSRADQPSTLEGIIDMTGSH